MESSKVPTCHVESLKRGFDQIRMIPKRTWPPVCLNPMDRGDWGWSIRLQEVVTTEVTMRIHSWLTCITFHRMSNVYQLMLHKYCYPIQKQGICLVDNTSSFFLLEHLGQRIVFIPTNLVSHKLISCNHLKISVKPMITISCFSPFRNPIQFNSFNSIFCTSSHVIPHVEEWSSSVGQTQG